MMTHSRVRVLLAHNQVPNSAVYYLIKMLVPRPSLPPVFDHYSLTASNPKLEAEKKARCNLLCSPCNQITHPVLC